MFEDLLAADYVNFDLRNTPAPDRSKACQWKGQPVMCGARDLEGGLNRLWRNDSHPGKPRVTDVSVQSGAAAPGMRFSLPVTTLDYDRDGWPEIYVAVDSQPSILYHNNCNGTFTDTAVEMDVAYSKDGREEAGMGNAAADFDGDDYLDMVKTNFIDDTPNLHGNAGGRGFSEVTVPAAFGKLAEASCRGLAIGDYDNDGDVDIFITNMNGPPSLLRNDGGNRRNFLNIRLMGQKSNRDGIGARVALFRRERSLVNEVRSGSTFMSQSDLRLHFGLGEASVVDRMEIEWPGGAKETIRNIPVNVFVTVAQGKGIIRTETFNRRK